MLDAVQDSATYGDRPAWAIYYRRPDCKLQICSSARDGGIDFFLAPPEAPNELGLDNRSKKWHYMLMLSDIHDDIPTPGLNADDTAVMSWMKDLFEIHFRAAHKALLSHR
ncbi:hypothetical protein [Mycobacteroides chelonae]|uniref:hypothetical protein n=1 Tax=Mycobacteroides chelonae TaxID=1774 RepID=UPI0006189B07|nr:hypothetical protein [Mycobacteroides chelonae]AKC37575.1 hypothetical protein GR01_01955 [Mycobacteroides chelonae]ANA96640.1 hypothetical protein BB28_01995 [Mycobacteroides chelonae CCUG 47445]OLT81238.1 hypothetical protein BKG56_03015 [Mycobacteroides chelonae]ORV17788.1 hypothetical protein AWB96_03300 [Mycobacteroides chelonae]